MIELLNITKRFAGVAALQDVSLELHRGERLAIVGENGAGKSSLMNVLYGLYQPDSGEIRFSGNTVRMKTPAEALSRGVGMVHQHFTLVPTLCVTDNVILGEEPVRWGLIDKAQAAKNVAATCEKFGFQFDPAALVGELSVGSQQKVEIVKALYRGVTTLILDEPTAVLTPQEADELFAVTRRLSDGGLTVVLISHKLREVLSFATRIMVMRRGKKVTERRAEETTAEQLAELMVGTSTPIAIQETQQNSSGPTVLSLENLEAPGVKALSMVVKAGEILGIAGVDGNGQREFAEVLTGLRPWTSGHFIFFGNELNHLTPASARTHGIAHIPEDRLSRAIISDMSVEENASLGRHRQAPFAHGHRIDFTGRRAKTSTLLEDNDVRPRDPLIRAGALSGGNQQKLVVARELDSAPRLLVAVQPTRGLDIGAVKAVHEKLRAHRNRGCAIVLVSLDLDEVTELSDRLVVFCAGRITGEFEKTQFDERRIGRCMLGVRDA